eukprot:gnl/MRDRNA2_/MRDRNA2_111149_c0_seq1.p1 gnl/MRDRNA2_/MRDRNA2_111149_c0~~gnl/MRDRNA2_/MRDRNA2_111149_c0_seq1.p1  ORF type:complete len:416 (-),score=87.04 gnl/MRDRNA2_/MRDRNA2_111149_c0_seq1:186-1433(-)
MSIMCFLKRLAATAWAWAWLAHAAEDAVQKYYGSFESPAFENTTYDELKHLLLRGRPFVVLGGAKGLPMSSWNCDAVQKEFPDSRIRHEGGKSDVNGIKMSSDWQKLVKPFPLAKRFPDGAPQNRPFYWDIAKAFQNEQHRKWGKNPGQAVKKLVESSAVPYFLPKQESRSMGFSSEMWFHPKDAGAAAHMDPHCRTTISMSFSGTRKWRMMVPPAEPHPDGYFDGEVYGARDPSRKNEWQPTFEFEAPAGSAVIVYPGMIHETRTVSEECSSSISQTFSVPIAAAYYRAFWPRFAMIHEDIGRCSDVVEGMVTLGSGTRVKPSKAEKARSAAEAFAAKVDTDGDKIVSEAEINAVNRSPDPEGGSTRMLEELVAFHDVNDDGTVTIQEIVDSWVMYASAMARVKAMTRGRQPEL